MNYDVDDLVVVPGCGVGRVEEIEQVDVGDVSVRTYRIDLGEEAGRFWVPIDRADAEGVRPPMSKKKVKATYALIQEQKVAEKRTNWRHRRKRYEEMMLSNTPGELAVLIGELAAERARKREKKQVLSHHERRIFERTQRLMVQEIAAATGQEVDVVEQNLQQAIDAVG